jgi:hypothetical protein
LMLKRSRAWLNMKESMTGLSTEKCSSGSCTCCKAQSRQEATSSATGVSS